MQLAVFTTGAALRPVMRNFEAFLASLGAQANSAGAVSLIRERDARLKKLHRDLYDALLRPSESYAAAPGCFADYFLPDLASTDADALLEALLFYFLRRSREEVSVSLGLSALRAVFFNHEAADPALWIQGAHDRLRRLRADFPLHTLRFRAPAGTRENDMAFVIAGNTSLPPRSSGWVWGELRQGLSGYCEVSAFCGLDPSLDGTPSDGPSVAGLDAEIINTVRAHFGWQRTVAA